MVSFRLNKNTVGDCDCVLNHSIEMKQFKATHIRARDIPPIILGWFVLDFCVVFFCLSSFSPVAEHSKNLPPTQFEMEKMSKIRLQSVTTVLSIEMPFTSW